MTIKVIDTYKLMKRHCAGGHPHSFQTSYQVLAIRRCRWNWRNKWQYLVDYDDCLEWWDADLFELIDEIVPENWVVHQYKKFHTFKNRKYDFSIPINYYHGPKEFIENADFFFDIYENLGIAYDFFHHYSQRRESEKDCEL